MSGSIQRLKYCEKAIEIKNEIEGNFILLAEYLHHIKENNLYEPQWSSFEEFIQELKISPNVAYKLIQIYRTFIVGYGFTTNQIITVGGFSLLQDILPVVTSKKTAEYWLHLTTVLTRSDLRKELLEAKTGLPMAQCQHIDTYVVCICRNCGEKQQVHE